MAEVALPRDEHSVIQTIISQVYITISGRPPSGRDTGMIASSSTFLLHPGRVIKGLFRQFHSVWHGTEALVYSNHPREAAASSYLSIIFGLLASGVPWFFRSTAVLMQLSHQGWRRCRPW